MAVETGNIDVITELIKNVRINFNLRGNCGAPPFHVAVDKNHINVVKKLLKDVRIDINE